MLPGATRIFLPQKIVTSAVSSGRVTSAWLPCSLPSVAQMIDLMASIGPTDVGGLVEEVDARPNILVSDRFRFNT